MYVYTPPSPNPTLFLMQCDEACIPFSLTGITKLSD